MGHGGAAGAGPDTSGAGGSRADRGATPARRAVVAAVDGTAPGERALTHALRLARRLGGRLDLLRVVPPEPGGDAASGRPALVDEAREYLAALAERVAREGGLPARQVHPRLVVGEPGPEVVRHAEGVAAAALVLAAHARPSAPALLGEVTLFAMRASPSPVLVVPPAAWAEAGPEAAVSDDWPRTLLVATDGDSRAEEAFAPLAALAAPGATGVVLTVTEPQVVPTSLLAGGGPPGEPRPLGVAAVAERLRAAGLDVAVETVARTRPARVVLDEARDRGADLIAVATHGRRGLERLFGGSVAEALARDAAVPVWVGHLRD